MFPSFSRTATVTVVALLMVLASVPAAQASPLSGSSFETSSGWFDAALSWLGNLLSGGEAAQQQQFDSAFAASKPDVEEEDGFGETMSGPCIDPAGRPRCF